MNFQSQVACVSLTKAVSTYLNHCAFIAKCPCLIPFTKSDNNMDFLESEDIFLFSEYVVYFCFSEAINFSFHVCACIYLYTCVATLEEEMATHSSILAWKTPWMEEPRRLQSMGSLRVGHD